MYTGIKLLDTPVKAVTTKILCETHNLSITYFVPKDLDTLPRWKKRISDVMIYAQGWYAGSTGKVEMKLIRE